MLEEIFNNIMKIVYDLINQLKAALDKKVDDFEASKKNG